MVLGLIGGDIRRSRPLVERYPTAGQAVGHAPDTLKLGPTIHFYVGKTFQGAREDLVPVAQDPGRTWLTHRPDEFQAVSSPFGALMTSSTQEVIDKFLTEHKLLGTSRFMGRARHLTCDSVICGAP
nr:hypothetical protein [Streptomyces exfoliatus]